MGCAQTSDCYRFRVTTIVIATRNAHKVGEIRAILGGASQILTLNDFPDPPKVVEDAGTFAGNATKKAVELARWLAATFPPTRHSSPLFVLADDSGLEVDALNGAPGVHSARFAAMDRSADSLSANSPDADNNARLLRLLKDVPLEKRTARFRCVIALVEINPQSATRLGEARVRNPQLFDGACEGRIGFEPHGKNGFGYDPLFVPVDFEQTFAELGEDVKNKLSHRARALDKLKAFFTTKAV
jgi:XTP/dITP diphosphohydrolase